MRLGIRGSADIGAGVLFGGIAAAFWFGMVGEQPGTIAQMGPAYMPRCVAVLLGCIAAGLTLRGVVTTGRALPTLDLRAVLFPLAAALVFAATLEPVGLGLSAAATVGVAATAKKRRDWVRVGMLAVGLSAASCLLFSWALGLPLPVLPVGFR